MIRDGIRYGAGALAVLILCALVSYCLWLYLGPGDLDSAYALAVLLASCVIGATISLVGGR